MSLRSWDYLGFKSFVGLINVKCVGDSIRCGVVYVDPVIGLESPLFTLQGAMVGVILIPQEFRGSAPLLVSSPKDNIVLTWKEKC